MTDRTCPGCGVEIIPHPRERNPRVWCSQRCRSAFNYRTRPEYRQRELSRKAERYRATYQPVRHNCRCVVCGSEFESRTTLAMYCSRSCKKRVERQRRDPAKRAAEQVRYRAKNPPSWDAARKAAYQRRRALKRGATVETVVATTVFDRDGWRCGICSGTVDRDLPWPDPMSASLDHIIPISRGGQHSYANTQLAHLTCNIRKGAIATV